MRSAFPKLSIPESREQMAAPPVALCSRSFRFVHATLRETQIIICGRPSSFICVTCRRDYCLLCADESGIQFCPDCTLDVVDLEVACPRNEMQWMLAVLPLTYWQLALADMEQVNPESGTSPS